MRRRDIAAGYAKGLERALNGLRTAAGGPGSLKSLGFCLTLALIYALLAALAGWGGGAADVLGEVPLFERPHTTFPPVVDKGLSCRQKG